MFSKLLDLIKESTLLFLFVFITFIFIYVPFTHAQTKNVGKISGILVDAQTGDPLIGANVYLEKTTLGAATDLEGFYFIPNVPAGEYVLIVSSIGYSELKITGLKVTTGDITKLDLSVTPEILESETIVVEAKVLENTDASLLKSRQKSYSVSDAVSSETIARVASSDAADAMKIVTGASVVGGKYVYIRGLGDRYSNTQLNGAELPSADPDKKAFNMDIVPSKLLDNIVTKKTFTPDEPGSFSGGLVNIGTKAFPDAFYVEASAGMSYNSQSTFNNNFLTATSSGSDWRGVDDGMRDLPEILQDPNTEIPLRTPASREMALAMELDAISKSFNREWAPYRSSGPLNQNYSFSIGNRIDLGGNPFGYIFSMTYSNNASFYDNGEVGRWQLSGTVQEVKDLKIEKLYQDTQSEEEVLVGTMGTLSYQITKNHEFSFDVVSTQSGIKTSRYMSGIWPDQLTGNEIYETRSIEYTERNLNTYQLKAKHHLPFLADLGISWLASLGNTNQNQPDLKFFSNTYRPAEVDGRDTVYYSIDNNLYNYPTRFWRSLDEDKQNLKIDFSLPFKQWRDLGAKFKFGGLYAKTDRQFTQKHYEFRQQDVDYTGDPVEFFSIVGITDSTNLRRIRFGNYAYEVPSVANNYDGSEEISAAYAMIELPITYRLRFVGGARFETTDMEIFSLDTTVANLTSEDWLPAASLIYQLQDNMNLRFAFGRTLARPTLRELSPLRTFEFLGDDLYGGNPYLVRTLIDNFDFRWEWFERPGEIYAVSAFYKKFKNPIERYYDIGSEKYSHQNVPEAIVYGAEFEIRKGLDIFASFLSDFSINSNLSLIHSEVTIPEKEMEVIRNFDSNPDNKRPLYGQSPYLINIELIYSNPRSGTSASVLYNVFGERLWEVVVGATPDVYEQPRPVIDIVFSQRIMDGLSFKAGLKNLLDSAVSRVQTFNGNDYSYHRYNRGRNFGIGLSYSM